MDVDIDIDVDSYTTPIPNSGANKASPRFSWTSFWDGLVENPTFFPMVPWYGPLIWTPIYTNYIPYSKQGPVEQTPPESKGPISRAHRKPLGGIEGGISEVYECQA